MTTAAPASPRTRALTACSSPRPGSGMRIDGLPDIGELGDRARAGAADDEIGGGVDIGKLVAHEFEQPVTTLHDLQEAAPQRRQASASAFAVAGPVWWTTWTRSRRAGSIASIRWLSGLAPRAPPVT